MIFVPQSKGFTLVELLVVLSIMSFLASIVITSVTGARSKGVDSSIKQTMNNMRAQAQLFYESQNPFTYTGVCTNTGGVSDMISEVNRLSGNATPASCDATAGTVWAAASYLKGGGVWCVDGSGVGRSKDAGGTAYATPAGAITSSACN